MDFSFRVVEELRRQADGIWKPMVGELNERGEQCVVSLAAARWKVMDDNLNQMICAQLIEKVQRFRQDIGSTATAADKTFAGTTLHFGLAA